MSGSARELVLVRHGRSAHVEAGWLNADGLRRWMTAYDAAEIALHHPPPSELRALTDQAARVVASDLPRAAASAQLLAPGRVIERSMLLRETPLETAARPLPSLGGLRLPLRGWALVIGARWLAGWRPGALPPGADAQARDRAAEAAGWLVTLAEETPGRVVVVTHTTFRLLLAQALLERGWRGPKRRPFHVWSAWRFTPGADRGTD